MTETFDYQSSNQRRDEETQLQKEVTFEEFQRAWQVFSGDLSLVHASHLKAQSPFSPPLPHYNDSKDDHKNHNYNLTILTGSESEVKAQLKKIRVLAIGCMDWRFANALYNRALKDEEVPSAVHPQIQDYSADEIMLVTVAGGIVQDGDDRVKAMETIIKYVSRNVPNLEIILAAGHCNRCGAIAKWTEAADGHVCAGLGTIPGKPDESQGMGKLIRHGMKTLLSSIHGLEIRVKGLLLELAEPIEHGQDPKVVIFSVDPSGPSLSVADLNN